MNKNLTILLALIIPALALLCGTFLVYTGHPRASIAPFVIAFMTIPSWE